MDLRFKGRWAVVGFGDVAESAVDDAVGGDCGSSGFGVLLPLLCVDGDLVLLPEELSFWTSD